MYLTDEIKQLLEKKFGIPYEEIINMDLEDEIQFVEGRTGNKLVWNKGVKIEGLPVSTIQDTDKKIKKLTRKGRLKRNV